MAGELYPRVGFIVTNMARPAENVVAFYNRILQERIGHLLTRPVGRQPNEVRRSYANFTYQAGSWTKPRRKS